MSVKFSKLTVRRPSPSLVISVKALIVAVGGGTLAFAALSKKTVNKIANKDANSVFSSRIGGASVANSTNAANTSHARNSDRLGGMNPSDFGAVLSGRIDTLTTVAGGTESGAATGVSTASGVCNNTLSPNHDLTARDFSVQLTNAPGGTASRTFYYASSCFSPTDGLPCVITGSATSCNSGAATKSIPASSILRILEVTGASAAPAAADAMFGVRLTP